MAMPYRARAFGSHASFSLRHAASITIAGGLSDRRRQSDICIIPQKSTRKGKIFKRKIFLKKFLLYGN